MKTIGGHENPSWLPRSLATGGRVSFIGAVRPLLCNGIQSGPDRMRDDRVKSHWKQRFAYNTKGALTKPIKYCTAQTMMGKEFPRPKDGVELFRIESRFFSLLLLLLVPTAVGSVPMMISREKQHWDVDASSAGASTSTRSTATPTQHAAAVIHSVISSFSSLPQTEQQ